MTNQEIVKIYDSFPKEKQDCSKSEFIKRVKALTDPIKAQQDAMQVVHGRVTRRAIDGAINGRTVH